MKSLEADLALIDHYDVVIRDLELTALRQARGHDLDSFERLKTIPGIGKVLALTILYEIHDIGRFPRVQEFASYSRLVKCQKSSVGKVLGTSGNKIGNAHLKWAFSEAAVLLLGKCPEGKKAPGSARAQAQQGQGALDPRPPDRASRLLHAGPQAGLRSGALRALVKEERG